MLKRIRQIFASIFIVCITLLFLDFTGTVHMWLGWMARIQFLPAVLAVNVAIILFLIILTLLFGRIYCSIVCPLGVFQDIISWINGRRKKMRFRFFYSPAHSWLRYSILYIFIISLFLGIGSFVALLAPYSAYGRIVNNLFQPIYKWGNNILARLAEYADSYLFYQTEVWLKSIPIFLTAVVTFITLIILAWRNGRTYCNTICPVGTILGFFSRFSLFRPVLDAEKCKHCGLCSRGCKAACIDYKNHGIDYSRCVACMDCIETCKHGAISYKIKYGKTKKKISGQEQQAVTPSKIDTARRSFLTTTAVVAVSSVVKAQEKKVDGGLAIIQDKQVPRRSTRIVPPGAMSIRNFETHCTACQLCVSVCPNDVLRPSNSLANLMQPEMSYEKGYCRPECTRCSEVCPSGAIHPITRDEKAATLIGHAVWLKKNCIPLNDGEECGNCSRHCPTRAIEMIPSVYGDKNSPKIPVINEWRCIGCGTCENLCPARPFSSIYVEGYNVHRKE